MKRLTTWLVLGMAVVLAYAVRRRRGARPRRPVPVQPPAEAAEIDPTTLEGPDALTEELVEAIAGWHIDPTSDLDVDANAHPELAPEELVVDRELPDDDRAQAHGEHWLEHLQAASAEVGPEPEHVLDVVDDSDPHTGHHKTATSDTPVADRGSGGPGGL